MKQAIKPLLNKCAFVKVNIEIDGINMTLEKSASDATLTPASGAPRQIIGLAEALTLLDWAEGKDARFCLQRFKKRAAR